MACKAKAHYRKAVKSGWRPSKRKAMGKSKYTEGLKNA